MDSDIQKEQNEIITPPTEPLVSQKVTPKFPKRLVICVFLVVIVILGLISEVSYSQIQKNKTVPRNKTALVAMPSKIPTPALSPTKFSTPISVTPTVWKTYTSKTEKASFKYPSDWKVIKPITDPPTSDADEIGLQSPDGEIRVSWVSSLSGFGGACDPSIPLGAVGSCFMVYVLDKTPIKNASNLLVVSDIVTKDGKIYEPVLAVQDADSSDLTQTGKTMGYAMYNGRNNGKLPYNNGTNALVLFSTGGPYASGPSLTQAEAKMWFSRSDVGQAKQILLSLTY
ncbi:MAG TPA: hypothetical protein VLF93_07190 [Candidatus Saccharimonadales bacterium]|nr:hypothetical protein [Candidatus Saccharimonadales bacterium]